MRISLTRGATVGPEWGCVHSQLSRFTFLERGLTMYARARMPQHPPPAKLGADIPAKSAGIFPVVSSFCGKHDLL